MTRDPERDRLAVAKADAWTAYNKQTFPPMSAWDAYLDAWLALHEYDRAKWNETHSDLEVTPQ